MSYNFEYDTNAKKLVYGGPTSTAGKRTIKQRRLRKFRRDLGYEAARYIRLRVSKQGRGSTKQLKLYSENDFFFKKSPKAMWDEKSFIGKLVFGGYKAYREKVGLQTGHFAFENTGNAWADWDFTVNDESGVVAIGFSDPINAEAAEAAMRNGRPDMLDLSDQEMQMILDKIIDTFEDEILGDY